MASSWPLWTEGQMNKVLHGDLFSYHQRWLLGDMVIVPVCSGPDWRVDSVWETVRSDN